MKKRIGTILTLFALGLAPASHALHYTSFEIELTGANEVGAPGDPDGIGMGTLMIDGGANEIVWDFMADNIFVPIIGFHIHEAPAGANGPVVFNFQSMLMGSAFDPVAQDILANPSDYYLNIHTEQFPAGALRGQVAQAPVERVSDSSTAAVGAMAIASLLCAGRRYRAKRATTN